MSYTDPTWATETPDGVLWRDNTLPLVYFIKSGDWGPLGLVEEVLNHFGGRAPHGEEGIALHYVLSELRQIP